MCSRINYDPSGNCYRYKFTEESGVIVNAKHPVNSDPRMMFVIIVDKFILTDFRIKCRLKIEDGEIARINKDKVQTTNIKLLTTETNGQTQFSYLEQPHSSHLYSQVKYTGLRCQEPESTRRNFIKNH